jgi:hypothetical protein
MKVMAKTVTSAERDNVERGYAVKETSPAWDFFHSLQSHVDPGSG